MKSILAFIKLIRIQNLLIIAGTQYSLRYLIVKPLVEKRWLQVGEVSSEGFNMELIMTDLQFFLMVLSTVIIAAAGYIINDYFDLKLDRINKPDKIIIGVDIKRRVAMGAHIVMNILGFFIGLFVAYSVGNWNLAFIQVFAIISLWYYSTHFKFGFMSGNLVIALMAALIPIMVGLYDIPLLNQYMQEFSKSINTPYNPNYNFNREAFWTIGFGLFAFTMTMAREVTKDIADMDGDEQYGAETVPIKLGVGYAKYFINAFYIITICGVLSAPFLFQALNNTISIAYSLMLVLFLISCVYFTVKASKKEQFLKASNLNKIVSIVGILFTVVYYIAFIG